VVADNQVENIERLVEAGAALSLGSASELTASKIADIMLSVERQPQLLSKLGTNAAGICDGRGAQRVAMRLLPATTRSGESVWLRPATAADVDVTYEWQCQPETRRFGRNSAVPTLPEHEAWFAARLRNPESLLSVIMCDGEPVGTLRLDLQGSSTYEISIVVSSARHGRGLGLAALELARRLVPEAQIRAEILPGNVRSEALFTKAGYLPLGYGWRSIASLEQNAHSSF
jgi:RimJ/RimL family protein N-acetyltransferase